MKISLVIPAYNEEAFIGDCLDSVLAHAHNDLTEIIVVDNNSSDNTAAVAASRPGVTVIHEPRQGTGNARQTGAEHASGDIVAYIDADSRIAPGWVERIQKEFQDTAVVLLSGPYRYEDSERYPAWLLNWMWRLFVPIGYFITGYVGNGGNCVVRREALMQAGGNDRSLAFYGDDTDLAKRLHRVGTTLWRNSFTVTASARRFDEQGLGLYLTYLLNFWWPVLFNRPFTSGSHPTSSQKVTSQTHEPR